MKFYIRPTEEHPNNDGVYELIRSGTLKVYAKASGNIEYTEVGNYNLANNSLWNQDDAIEIETNIEGYLQLFYRFELCNSLYYPNPICLMGISPLLYTCIATPYDLRFIRKEQGNALVGVIKAYKANSNKTLPNDITALSYPKQEIYTIDIEQTIRLNAFVYEKQTSYENSDDIINGNITKTLANLNDVKEEDIAWAFKIVNGTYLASGNNTRSNPFPTLGNKQTINISNKQLLSSIPDGYVEIEDKQGSSIDISLKDIFNESLLDSSNEDNIINKNIIFFAYNKEQKNSNRQVISGGINTNTTNESNYKDNAYCMYSNNGKTGSSKIVTNDRVTSIELNIVESRFRLEFDGKTLAFLENEHIINEWEARSGSPINNLAEDSNENKYRKRFKVESTDNKSFYYDMNIHTDSSTKPLTEGDCNVFYNPNNLQFQINNIDLLSNQQNIQSTLKSYINKMMNIPLKVKYQKRILITIDRYKQTLESTKARMDIYLDGKRVKAEIEGTISYIKTKNNKTGKEETTKVDTRKIKDITITDEIYNPTGSTSQITNSTTIIGNPYAYILERPGPDSIAGEVNLRIPEGRYDVEWQSSGNFTDVLRLTNNYVGSGRGVLIHTGNSPKDSAGCLLINKTDDGIDNKLLDSGVMKNILANAINTANGFIRKYIFDTNETNETEVVKHIEIKVINTFKG